MGIQVRGGTPKIVFAPDEYIGESAAVEFAAVRYPETPRHRPRHAPDRLLARHAQRPDPPVELRHGRVGARMGMVRPERSPRGAQGGVRAGQNPWFREDFVEIRLAHGEKEGARPAPVLRQNSANQRPRRLAGAVCENIR